MSRRIEVELTSTREDGSWTWRAAGARQPKGDLPGSLLYEGAALGDVVKIEAEFHLDGIEVLEVFPPKRKQARTDLLERKVRPLRDDELVSEVRSPGGRKGGGRRRRDGDGEGRGRGDGPRRGRGSASGDRDGGRGRPREQREERPKPKRLRPGRTHRNAVMAEIPEEHKPIAEQVLQGGMPAVRSAIDKQNEEAKAAGQPAIDPAPIVAIAEPLVAKFRTAEWRDRADAATVDIAELDLRDLRSVVVAADAAARDEETRALADQLRNSLSERVESDHVQWLRDLQAAVDEGRTVRALRLSSRPVKAGAPLPTELANRLTAAASAALADDVFPDRWATVLDALAFTPIRNAVTPAGYPADPPEEFLEAVRRVADRVPAIAAHYGIDPSEAEAARKRRPRQQSRGRGGERGAKNDRSGRSDRGGRNERGDRDGARGERRGGKGRGDGRGPKKPSIRDLPPVPGAEKPEPEPEEPAAETPAADEATAEAAADEATAEAPVPEAAADEAAPSEPEAAPAEG